MGSITHTKVSAIADDPAASTAGEVLPSDWNDVHTFSLTKTDVGLDNVDNTSDANKPVSTATQTALDLKVDENAAITAATKTKITYDAKGLVTAGTDATTADIADSTNKRYVTDAQLTVIGNTSGTNTGDQTSVAGNAGTATALATARTIDGVSFNGTANITVIAPATVAATGKTTPVDADVMPLADSAASNVLKKVTWSNIKATLKTYFDTLYIATVTPGTSGNVLTSNGGAWTSAAPSAAAVPYLNVRDQKTSGTDGGTFTSGAWQTRTLNTTVTNTITSASLGSNQITLPAGTFQIRARAPAVDGTRHKAKLYNITDTADVILGSNSQATGASSQTDSWVIGQFTIAGTKVFELQHQIETTAGSYGLGRACNFGTEVYAEVEIWKVS